MASDPPVTVEPKTRLSRNVHIFGLTSFFNDTATEMAYWVLPAFLVSLGAGPAALGLIEGIAESVASFAKLGSGYLSDRVGRRKPLVILGYTVANAVKPILAITTAWWQVLLVRFSDRLSKGIRGAPRDVMLAESVDRERVGSAFGLLQAMDSAGAIAGPALALLILHFSGLRTVFWLAAIPGALSIIMALRAIETRHRREKPTLDKKPKPPLLHPHLPGSFYFVLAAITLFSLGNSSDMFLILRAQSVGISPKFAPLLGLVFNITYTAFSWPAGRLSDRVVARNGRGSRFVLAAGGYVVFAVVYMIFATAPSRAAIWAMMAFYGLYYALTNPVLRAMVADTAPPETRGRAFGIFYFVTSIATLLASLITGELWKNFGPAIPFHFSAILAVVAALMLLGERAVSAKNA